MKSLRRPLTPWTPFTALGVCLMAGTFGCSAPEDSGTVIQRPSTGNPATTSMPVGDEGDGDGVAVPPPLPPEDEGPVIALPLAPEMDPNELAEGQECAAETQNTELVGVTLVFGFDVSLSMGSNETDLMYKWEPIVAATKGFFTDPASRDISATLTFFPSTSVQQGGFGTPGAAPPDPTAGNPCDGDSYAEPDVALTALPSEAFVTAIDNVAPDRLGTPTMAVLQGTLDQAAALSQTNPANYAVVLVTDGLPALCNPTDDNVANVAALAAQGFADGVPVYVIGVDSPEGSSFGAGEDSIGNLNLIAEGGGTNEAFIIGTGDVATTIADFTSVIEQIKESTFSCAMPIPAAPEGQAFDKERVNVAYGNANGETPFVYDQTCAGEYAWRYDNADAPTQIELCPDVCERVKADQQGAGKLDVEFGCERRTSTTR